MKWKNLKLSGKFTVAFGSIITLLAIVAIWSISGINEIENNAKDVIEGNELRTSLSEKYIQHLQWTLDLDNYITNDSITEINVETDDHKCAFGQWYYGEGRKRAEQLAPGLKTILKDMENSHMHLHESATMIEKVFKDNGKTVKAKKKAIHIFQTETEKNLDELIKYFNSLAVTSKDEIMTDTAMIKAADSARIGTYIFSIIAIILGVILAFVIADGIIKAIKKGVNFATVISTGDLTKVVDINQKDEIGMLASSLMTMQYKVSEIINEVQDAISNITVSSQGLSSGASEQAASTEEVSSSMEEMMANIQNNSDNASQTEKIATNAANEINIGYKNVNQSVESMLEIADKINVIEEIAEKTDLLAINAAIEAARAGDHGKGFAVVAMEVRKLAERSQQAATEINSLSKNSVNVAQSTGKKMGEIVPEIEKTSFLVQEISAASQEQSTGADQVNISLQQLNQINQNTAANAEELASQAETLNEIIAFFKVDKSSQTQNSKKNEDSEKKIEVETHFKSTPSLKSSPSDEFEYF